MDDNVLTGEGSGEGESLSDTIAAALEDQQGDALISDLSDAKDAAAEAQEVDGQALPGDEGGVETPGHGVTDQADEGEAQSDQAQEETAPEPEPEPEPEPDTGTGTADQYRQVAEVYHDAVAPFREHLKSRGVAPSQAIQLLLNAEYQLSTGTPERKAQILTQLAKDYGVSLADMEDVEPVNSDLAQIHQRIGGIEQAIRGQRQQDAAQVRQSVEAEVATFEKEKDAAGNLLRPHMGKVGAAMGHMIGKNPSLTLQAAYEKAVQADPKLRQAPATKRRATPAPKRSQPGKAKAKPAKEMSLYDTVVEAHRSAVERTGA